MDLPSRELWVEFHGLFSGGVLVLTFAGAIRLFWNFKEKNLSDLAMKKNARRLALCLGFMAFASWLAALSGIFLVYPWYRENTPQSPLSRLLLDPNKAAWHQFGMEWKEHIVWISPLLLTTAVFLTWRHSEELAKLNSLRRFVFWLFLIGFFSASVAGLLGAMIHKNMPFA